MNYSNLRATDIPTCASLVVPKPGPLREESVMAGMKEKMMKEVRKYVKEECNEAGWPKSNLTQSEVNGMIEIKKKVEANEIVVFKAVHTEGDVEIDEKRVENIEGSSTPSIPTLDCYYRLLHLLQALPIIRISFHLNTCQKYI